MGHAVHYRTAAGESRLEDVPSLAEAVELVERLRNEDDAQHVRVFKEVPLEVRTYYKVMVAEEEPASAESAAPAAPAAREPVSDEPPPGAMNLSPPPATSMAATAVPTLEDDAEQPRRNSLFNRG